MTSVLLISDSERVQRIFQNVEATGVLKLQTASTLPSGEAQIASSPCDFTFVQSRISGFSGDILLRHLEKMLQKGATLVLLGDAEDAEQARRHGRQSVDLTVADDLLAQTVAAVVTGAPLPEREVVEAPAADKPAASKEEPAPSAPPSEAKEAEPYAAPAASSFQAADPLGSPFEEAMQRAAANVAPIKASLLEVEDRVEVGKKGVGAGKEPASPIPPAGKPVRPDQDDFFAGETLLEAMRRAEKKKSRRPYLLIVPALVLIAIPFISYTVGKRSPINLELAPAFKPAKKAPASPPAPPSQAVPAAPPATSGKAPAQPAPPAAAQQQAKPAPAPPAAAARPEPQPPQKSASPAPAAAKPAAKRGAERLPPMLEGTKPDPQYGKTHPGWERYVGLLAEYKLFRENNLYKALQVVPVAGGTISDDLFKRILLEFGGVDSYRVDSAELKGGYVIEQGSTNSNTALTIYRTRNKKMKGLVVYYR